MTKLVSDEEEEETGLALVTPLHPDWITAAHRITDKIRKPTGLHPTEAVRAPGWTGAWA
jgi:hypothetical protein